MVRHGRTAANASGLLLGRADPGLDTVGVAQAAALGATVASARPDRLVTSPLARARATAAAVSDSCGGLEITVDERWIELDYGSLDQTPIAAIPAETWAQWRADIRFAPSGGETLAALGERVRSACEELMAADGAPIVVVTHVSPVKAATVWALGVGDEVAWRLYVAPASITRIGRGPSGTASLRSFNDVGHLVDVGSTPPPRTWPGRST